MSLTITAGYGTKPAHIVTNRHDGEDHFVADAISVVEFSDDLTLRPNREPVQLWSDRPSRLAGRPGARPVPQEPGEV